MKDEVMRINSIKKLSSWSYHRNFQPFEVFVVVLGGSGGAGPPLSIRPKSWRGDHGLAQEQNRHGHMGLAQMSLD